MPIPFAVVSAVLPAFIQGISDIIVSENEKEAKIASEKFQYKKTQIEKEISLEKENTIRERQIQESLLKSQKEKNKNEEIVLKEKNRTKEELLKETNRALETTLIEKNRAKEQHLKIKYTKEIYIRALEISQNIATLKLENITKSEIAFDEFIQSQLTSLADQLKSVEKDLMSSPSKKAIPLLTSSRLDCQNEMREYRNLYSETKIKFSQIKENVKLQNVKEIMGSVNFSQMLEDKSS